MRNLEVKFRTSGVVLRCQGFATEGDTIYFNTPQNEVLKFDCTGKTLQEKKHWITTRINNATNSKVDIVAWG